MRKKFITTIANSPETWWMATGTNLVPYSYLKSSDMVNDDGATAPAGGRTYIYDYAKKRSNQDGYIRRIWTTVRTTGGAWKFKLFRPNGSNYDFVMESAWTPSTTGLQSHDLVTPLLCQPGDVIGVYLPENASIGLRNATAAFTYRYADGDVSTSNAFATQVASKEIHLGIYGYQPWLAASGDSIFEGHNTASNWHSLYHTGPAGTPEAEIMNQMRAIMPGLEYQNYAKGSQTYNWVNTTGISDAYTTYALKASVWLIMAGVNDVSAGRTWEQVAVDLGAIRARVVAGDLWICEILPWTAGTDLQAATIRTFNANLTTWCAANNARLILCHDAMGQIRVSTGEKDDLITAYNQDGVHLTQAGVNAIAAIIRASFGAVYK